MLLIFYYFSLLDDLMPGNFCTSVPVHDIIRGIYIKLFKLRASAELRGSAPIGIME